MPTCRVLAVAVVLLGVPACAPGRGARATSAAVRHERPTSSTSHPDVATPNEAVLSVPVLDSEAAEIAGRYAGAASSYRYDEGPDAWVAAVAPLCTPAWLDRLRSDPASPAGWDGVVGRDEVARADVVAVHPSRSRSGGQRAVVVLRVTVEGSAPATRTEVVEVELVRQSGRWLVGGS